MASDRKAYFAAYRAANKEKIAAYRAANKEKIAALNAARYATNKEKIAAQQAAYYATNKEKIAVQQATWQRANPGKVNAIVARRRAAKLQATPRWLTAEDHAQIEELYEMAASLTESTGIDHHVDHVVPLQGRQVKGLHVPWNLRILQATDNLKKKNKLDPALLEPMRLAA